MKRTVDAGSPGQIVILNGTPRSGKSRIATVIQNTFEGVWLNLGGRSVHADDPPNGTSLASGCGPGVNVPTSNLSS